MNDIHEAMHVNESPHVPAEEQGDVVRDEQNLVERAQEIGIKHIVKMIDRDHCIALVRAKEHAVMLGIPLGAATDPRIKKAVLGAYAATDYPTLRPEFVENNLNTFGLSIQEWKEFPGMQKVVAHAIAYALEKHHLDQVEFLVDNYFNAPTCDSEYSEKLIAESLNEEMKYRSEEHNAELTLWFEAICEKLPKAVRPVRYG